MLRLVILSHTYILSWREGVSCSVDDGRVVARRKKRRRDRLRTCPGVEKVEDRVLLTAIELGPAAAAVRAEVMLAAKSPTLLTGVTGTGSCGQLH